MGNNLTPEQTRAVKEFGKNIIVSAGAGSGKTKVLTERVFSHVLNDHVDIDRMLILTFTKAAALEMKKRIREILTKDETLSDDERNKQLNKIDSSYISTFDAYALSLVKKYHQLLGVDSTIEIIDSNMLKAKTKEYLDEILEEEYKKKEDKFNNLINHLCLKNDDDLRGSIIELNDSFSQIYNREEYLCNYIDNYYSEETINKQFIDYVDIIKLKIKEMDSILNELSEYIDTNKYFPYIDDLKRCDTYSELKESISIAKVEGRATNPKGTTLASDLADKFKDNLKKIKELTTYSKEGLINNYLNTKDDCLVLLDLINRLNNKLDEYKRDNNSYDYIDIMKMSIKLVEDNEDIRNEIKEYFKEILIDEYQDTNDLQDLFISYIANNNVYMVGDIKQSIYRFRNANPKIFMDKYDRYKNNDRGIAIDLTYNFRSREEVLFNINTVFNRIMTLETGGADYTNGHKMVCGNMSYESDGKTSQNNNLEFLSYIYDKDTKNEYPFKDLTKDEVEAFIVAKDIKDKIDNKYQVTTYDNNKMVLKDAQYKDFSILIDRGTNFDMFKEVLTYFNIPCVIKKEDKMSDSDLIVVLKNIFKLLSLDLNNTNEYEFKLAYVSLSRSFILEMSDNEIFDIVKNNTYKDTYLYKILLDIKENIEFKTISQILDEIIDKFNIYSNIYKIGEVNNNLVKINYLYDLASKLSNIGYTYIDFNEYLNNIFDSDDDITFNTEKEESNAVVITTIHKSKGLEYPIVYLPLLYKKFNTSDTSERIMFSYDLGLIIPEYVENRGLRDTFKKELFNSNYFKEEISERIRLLYVALTRAKEKLILVGPLTDNSKEGNPISKEKVVSSRSFLALLNMIYSDLNENNFIKEVDFNTIPFNKDYHVSKKDIFSSLKKEGEKIVINTIEPIIPISLSQSHFSKNSGLINEETIKKMEYGTKMHYFLETLDFNNPDYELVDKEFVDKIKYFLNSDLMKDKDKAKAYKEYEFIEVIDNEERHGIIDLLMEYDDHFDIIDYKLKNIDDFHYDEQLNGYREYISSISDKRVNCYLYSVIDGVYREVK